MPLSKKDAPNSKVIRIDIREDIPGNALVKGIAGTKYELLVRILSAGQVGLLSIPHTGSKLKKLVLPLQENVQVEWSYLRENDFVVSITS